MTYDLQQRIFFVKSYYEKIEKPKTQSAGEKRTLVKNNNETDDE